MWTSHEDFRDLVLNCWNQEVLGTKQFSLCKKFKSLKGVLTELNDKHYGHISTRAEFATKSLELVRLELHDDPINLQLQSEVARLRKVAMGLHEAERSFYYQQAICEYLSIAASALSSST